MTKPDYKPTFSERFEKHLFEKGISNDEMFKVLNIILQYSGVKTIRQFAEENNRSVQSVYQYKPIKTILGRKVVFDND